MRDRCTNPANACFERYGGRGITVCDRWRDSFDDFFADMGMFPSRDHSIERIDNLGAYEPSNCRWATRTEQGANKRNNVRLTLNGRTQLISEWARELGIQRLTIRRRINDLGWTPERALTTPVQEPGKYSRTTPSRRRSAVPRQS
jgi:hypothetical protein